MIRPQQRCRGSKKEALLTQHLRRAGDCLLPRRTRPDPNEGSEHRFERSRFLAIAKSSRASSGSVSAGRQGVGPPSTLSTSTASEFVVKTVDLNPHQ
jgi:hypothetical protein